MRKSGLANRGKPFETALERTCLTYLLKGKAVIHKRPTPFRVVSENRMGQLICTRAKKSTVDFDGVYRWRSIQFEAKSTENKRFDLSMLEDHQIEHMERAEKCGAIVFILVELKGQRTTFLIPNSMLKFYLKRAREGGRKSIALDELEVYGWAVETKNGVPLDFLSVVDRIYFEGEKKDGSIY